MRRPKILRNKKGLIGDIFGSIIGFVQGLFQLMPKTIKFFLLVFLLVLFAQLLTFVFNLFGIFCTSANIPVQTDTNFLTGMFVNMDLMTNVPDYELVGLEVIDPSNVQKSTLECSVCINDGTILFNDSREQIISTKTCFYNGRGGCVNCEHVDIVRDGGQDLQDYCYGDATTKLDSQKSFLAKQFCGNEWFGRCQPPEHYYYDNVLDQYVCADNTCEGDTAGQIWDDLLASKGATPLYKTINSTSVNRAYDGMAGIQCVDIRPKLTIWGIDLFDLRIWMVLMVISVLIWYLMHFRR